MLPARIVQSVVSAVLVAGTLSLATAAAAQSRPDARTQSAKKPRPPKAPAKAKKGRAPEPAPATEEAPAGDAAATAESAPPKAEGAGEAGVKAAGTAEATAGAKPLKGVKEEVNESGVKTYEFGAVEVEGRLRSPQILYFLRRVRAEFDATALGHRSFLRELGDTRNDPAFR